MARFPDANTDYHHFHLILIDPIHNPVALADGANTPVARQIIGERLPLFFWLNL
jgi:hypothetical protein